jgi:predicted ATPase
MIEEIDLSNIGDKYNTETKGILGKLSKINIFIGKNSSGKSRLLRKLFSQIHLPIRSKGLEAQVIVDAVEDIKEFFEDFTGIDNLSLDEFAHISEQRGSLT